MKRGTVGVDNGNWRNGDLAQLLKTHDPSERELALDEIKKIVGDESFNAWYDKTYRFRKSGKHVEYERAIFGKLETLRGIQRNIESSRDWLKRAKKSEKKWASENIALFESKLAREIMS